MSEPNGYLLHGTAFSSKEAAFEALVSNQEQETWFHKIWNENAQPYYFEPQPQLTIPKSIAERLDKEGSYDSAFVYPRTWELEVQGTLESCRRINVQKIYLISKALGVDLVKVVEND